MARQPEERRRARQGIPISARAAALAAQRKEERRAALAYAKAVEENEQAIKAFASIRLQRQKEACEAHARLVLLCHPVELLPPQCGMIPVVIPSAISLYKVVAANKAGCLVSVLDGQERYELNKWTLAKHGAASWPPVYACSSAFTTPMEAISEQFPPQSRMLKAPKVLVKLDALGRAYYHERSRTWALSKARVATLLTQLDPVATLDVHWALNGCDPLIAPLGQQQQHPSTSPPPLPRAGSAAPTTTANTSPYAAAAAQNAGPRGGEGSHASQQQHRPQQHDSLTSTALPSHKNTDEQPQQPQQPQQQQGLHVQPSPGPAPPLLPARPPTQAGWSDRHPLAHPALPSTSPPKPLPNSSHPHSVGPRLSAPIQRTPPSAAPLALAPSINLPLRFDGSYGSGAWRGAVQPTQLVARPGPCSPRSAVPPFPPPFDIGACARPPSPPRPPYNPAAGSPPRAPCPSAPSTSMHTQSFGATQPSPQNDTALVLQPLPPGRQAAAAACRWNSSSSNSSSRGSSPPPQPRGLHPHPRAPQGSSSLQAQGSIPSLASAPAATAACNPLEHASMHSQAITALQQTAVHLAPPQSQRHRSDQPPSLPPTPAECLELVDQPPSLFWS